MGVINISPIFAAQTYDDMPTLSIPFGFGFRFMFYANDHEPIHVHVVRGTSPQNSPCSPSRWSRTTG